MKRGSSSQDQDQEILKALQEMESLRAEYPAELFSARRSAFLDQVAQHAPAEAEAEPEPLSAADQRIINLLRQLRHSSEKYPPVLLVARRTDYVRQIAWLNWKRTWADLWTAAQKWNPVPGLLSRLSNSGMSSASFVLATVMLAVFLGYLFYENQGSLPGSMAFEPGIVKSGRILMETDAREVRIVCEPGLEPPLCLAGEFDTEDALTFSGNGLARPAVAKDSMPEFGKVYRAANINDGRYGPAASWVSNSRNSWIKIDLGKATPINQVTFGRDRLGEFNDGDPGQFVVALAVDDNVYADGNNSNDEKEYTPVFVSSQAGFTGTISGPETIVAQFDPQVARFIKITFENEGAAIDEVEAFLVPPIAGMPPGSKAGDQQPGVPATSSAGDPSIPPVAPTALPQKTTTALPTETLVPSDTPTSVPSDTPFPSDTPSPLPTNTPIPTDTPTPLPTHTRIPTDTPTPLPRETETPEPTYTPLPTSTQEPDPIETIRPASDNPAEMPLLPRLDEVDGMAKVYSE